jgi:AcrR family transcriptional regulator
VNNAGAVKRGYDSTLRQAQARATRRLIIDAAARLFTERGYMATSIDQVAEAAGVSRATVFQSVGGKPALLKAAYDVAIVGDDEPASLPERPRSRAIQAEPDPRRFLSRYVELVVEIDQRMAGIYESVRNAVAADPAIAALWETIQADRYIGAMHVVDFLVAKGGLRNRLERGAAADILWTLMDPTTYLRLVHDRGWSAQRYRSWLDQILLAQMVGEAAE